MFSNYLHEIFYFSWRCFIFSKHEIHVMWNQKYRDAVFFWNFSLYMKSRWHCHNLKLIWRFFSCKSSQKKAKRHDDIMECESKQHGTATVSSRSHTSISSINTLEPHQESESRAAVRSFRACWAHHTGREGVSDNLLEYTMTLSLLLHTMHRVLSMTNQ